MPIKPKIIKGNHHQDERGTIVFNNDFDVLDVRRIYFIENSDTNFQRAWQGHAIEKRYFSAVQGSFNIKLIHIENWQNPDENAEILKFTLTSDSGDILEIPPGFVNSIQALEENSKLLAMANVLLKDSNDDIRFPVNFFKNNND